MMGKPTMAMCSMLFVSVAFAETFVWRGGNGGGWSNADNWIPSGTPGAGDTVEVRAGADLLVEDADAALAGALAGIVLPAADATLVFNIVGDISIGGTISGKGAIVKNGPGTVRFLNEAKDGYHASAGITVNAGAVWYPQTFPTTYSSVVMNIGNVHVASGATLHPYARYRRTAIGNLTGGGTISQDVAGGKWGLIISPSAPCLFTGVLNGYLSVDIRGPLNLASTDNYYRGPTEINGSGGVLGVMSLGHLSDGVYQSHSSIGSVWYSATSTNAFTFSGSGILRYIGDGAVDTDRPIRVGDATNPTIDAGYGALTLDSTIAGAATGQSGVTLCSSNMTVASVLRGRLDEGAGNSFYLTKSGPGVWAIPGSANRTNKGVVGVEEGTLQFDALADRGACCSFGLSTLLAQKYLGEWDEAQAAEYAILLGSAQAVGTIEYTGDGHYDNAARDRPIAVCGQGGRILANRRLGLKGVFAADAAGSTLVLDGASTGSCLYDARDGEGPLSIGKTGSGTWYLGGELSFRGRLDVAQGTLIVSSTLGREYRWYRFTVREIFYSEGKSREDTFNSNDAQFRMRELAIYDDDGNRLNRAFLEAEDPENPAAGQIGVWNPNFSVDSYQSQRAGLERLCDESCAWNLFHYGYVAIANSRVPPLWDWRETWIPYVFRMAPGAAQASSYDFVTSEQDSWSASGFTMEASADGVFWDTVSSVRGRSPRTDGKTWAGANSAFAANQTHTGGYAFGMDNGRSLCTVPRPQLENATVRVAAGATLRGEGTVAIKRLEVDRASAGTMENVALAPDGVINVTGDESVTGLVELPLALSEVGGLDLGNLGSWQVQVNGRPRPSFRLVSHGGKLAVRLPGMKFILR